MCTKLNLSIRSLCSWLVCACAALLLIACASSSKSTGAFPGSGNVNRPVWVDSVDSVYSRQQYIAAVGHAANREMAEQNALANLTSIFGLSITADQKISNTYQEAVKNGAAANWTDSTAIENVIQTSVSMDSLVGAEIREVWFDNQSTYYAAAVMEKVKTVKLYTDMIQANLSMITNLLNMNQSQKNSLEGFARYQFAAAAADVNTGYANMLKVIGSAPPEGLVTGNDYRLEAVNITKAIPVGIIVKNDRASRIQNALAKALNDLGFRSGGVNSRYRIEAELSLSEGPPSTQYKYARYVITANFMDTADKTVLVSFTENDREGSITQAEAENRAVGAAERKINEEYAQLLKDYLSQLLPKK